MNILLTGSGHNSETWPQNHEMREPSVRTCELLMVLPMKKTFKFLFILIEYLNLPYPVLSTGRAFSQLVKIKGNSCITFVIKITYFL